MTKSKNAYTAAFYAAAFIASSTFPAQAQSCLDAQSFTAKRVADRVATLCKQEAGVTIKYAEAEAALRNIFPDATSICYGDCRPSESALQCVTKFAARYIDITNDEIRRSNFVFCRQYAR